MTRGTATAGLWPGSCEDPSQAAARVMKYAER